MIVDMAMTDPHRHFLDAALEGDNVALGRLVQATQPAVWKICSLLGSRGNTEDLSQETYLRAMRSLSGYRGESTVVVWLMSIARHVCADDIRKRQRQRRLVERVTRYERTNHDTAGELAPVDDILSCLDRERREAFLLTQYVGLRYDEAALVLDCPVGTVRSRVSRARAQLSEIIRSSQAQ